MFSHGTLDPLSGLAKVMGRIKQTIQLVGRKLLTDLRGFAKHLTQMRALLYRTTAALFDQMVGSIAPDALSQRNAHCLGEHQPFGGLQIARHTLGIDLQTG
ncbi:hypothetical protein ALQ88_01553 [Pseudomonas savastanoi]|nr:hypothetical protein ALQ88_01553 [Pseudomonas savastanoi]